jgi:prepilin-type N-terminal cleavage/methylation domain-containing protein
VKALHHANRGTDKRRQKGFSLLELMVSVAILVIVAGAVIMGMIRMTWSQSTVMNRTQMHSSVRNATELMQQEVGQAGKVASQPGLQFTTAITVPAGSNSVTTNPTITTTATTGAATDRLYVGENLVVDPSTTNEETVMISVITPTTITATFANSHAANVPVLVLGGFASGIVPPDTSPTMLVLQDKDTASQPLTGGPGGTSSTGSVLKLYGDINGDGTMYYVTYNCNQAAGTLYRYVSNTADVNTATSLTYTLLLDNLGQNPPNPPSSSPAPCFTYTTKDMPVTLTGGGTVTETFVTNVAVTLTVNTQNKDMQTSSTQTETKALLNIAPRNVVEALEQAGSPSGYTRAQPMPHNVYVNLLSSSLPK